MKYTMDNLQVVYDSQTYFAEGSGPYGYEKVGIRYGDHITWFNCTVYPGGNKTKYEKDEAFCKDIVSCLLAE